MFSLSAIQQPYPEQNQFKRGCYANTNKGIKLNGMQAMIMQSQYNLERVLSDFEVAIAAGLNPNDVKDQIFKKYKITDADFTDFDAKTLIKKVEAMYKSHQSRRF